LRRFVTALNACYLHEQSACQEAVSSTNQRRADPLPEQREAHIAGMRRDAMLLQQLGHLGFGLPPRMPLECDRGGTEHEPVRAMDGRGVV